MSSAPEPIAIYPQASRFQGGCHCGAVRFEVEISTKEAVDCTCSICCKKGILHYIVPEEKFQILAGETCLTDYRFNTETAEHLFCARCGIHAFYRPRSHPDCWDVNLRCLDAACDPNFLASFEVELFDGQQWEQNVQKLIQDDKVSTTDSANASQ